MKDLSRSSRPELKGGLGGGGGRGGGENGLRKQKMAKQTKGKQTDCASFQKATHQIREDLRGMISRLSR